MDVEFTVRSTTTLQERSGVYGTLLIVYNSCPPLDGLVHAVATYSAEVAIPDGQVVLRLLLVLQHNHTRTTHMDNEASCRK